MIFVPAADALQLTSSFDRHLGGHGSSPHVQLLWDVCHWYEPVPIYSPSQLAGMLSETQGPI